MFVRFHASDMKRAPAGDYPAGALSCGNFLSGRRESNPRNQFGSSLGTVQVVCLSAYVQVSGLDWHVQVHRFHPVACET